MYGTSNQYDLNVVIRKITYEGGIGEELFLSNSENIDKIYPTSNDWVLWANYAAEMDCTKQYSEISQSAQAVFHLELWWSKFYLEQLNYHFFSIEENTLISIGARGTDITKPRFNNLVKREGFQFNDD